MKSKVHAIAGVLGFFCVLTFWTSTALSELLASHATVAVVKDLVFKGMFILIPALLVAGASGMSLLGKRTDSLAVVKQKRGPIAFMTSLFVLLPSSYFLSSWASEGALDGWFYGVQAVELAGSTVCLVMIGLNIRDGLALRGRIGARGATSPSIEQRNGGPLVAIRLPVLASSSGEALASKPVMALCRCGASKNKPYCDGSHNDIGFDSSPSEDRSKDEILTYEGKEVTIHYNRLLCSHAAECGRRQKAAFDSSRKPWIVPDNAPKQGILDVVKACPSGALRFSLPGQAPQHAHPDAKGITVEQDGPYRVCGIPLASSRLAKGANPDKYVLCRCGASKNKPYCDGSHYDIGWKSSAMPLAAQ
ncbi:MAG: CDGSH iron-sulfur domain-containing protein [Deltaproteobacteria bacterium]|nr:CDGSH iron-sulfur domain-containing protein [Deltaproteobacteria bacterium]